MRLPLAGVTTSMAAMRRVLVLFQVILTLGTQERAGKSTDDTMSGLVT